MENSILVFTVFEWLLVDGSKLTITYVDGWPHVQKTCIYHHHSKEKKPSATNSALFRGSPGRTDQLFGARFISPEDLYRTYGKPLRRHIRAICMIVFMTLREFMGKGFDSKMALDVIFFYLFLRHMYGNFYLVLGFLGALFRFDHTLF